MKNKTIFNAEVNPFTGIVILSKTDWQETLVFSETDEWYEFEFNDSLYDFHFFYDEDGFEPSIYKVNGHSTDTSEEGQQIVNVTIKY